MYVWSRVSCSRPPTTFTGGRDTWTYAYHIRIHIHIVYICTCTYYIHIHYLQYIYTRIFPHTYILHIHTLLHTFEPHSDRSLWIFRCRPKNHFWAKSDGFNDTVLVSKSWSFASFLHHFASFFLVLPNVTGTGQNQRLFDFWSLTTFQSRPKKCSFWMSRYVYTCVNIYIRFRWVRLCYVTICFVSFCYFCNVL